MIYLDNAATTYQKPDVVIEAVMEAMRHMGNAGRGAHEASLGAARIVYETRMQLAELFGLYEGHTKIQENPRRNTEEERRARGLEKLWEAAKRSDGLAKGEETVQREEGAAQRMLAPSQVVFTANSTESLNIAIQGLLNPGDHVITTAMEHNSVLRPLYLMGSRGVELTIVPADKKGLVCYEDMENAIRSNTRAIICTHASNLTGNLNDIGRIGDICRRHGILFVLDASQTAGVFEIHMERMGIDVLCFTGHKSLMGPQGIGGLCAREGVVIRPLVVGGSGVHSYATTHPDIMPTALEAGTLNGHGIAGLHAALSYLKEQGVEVIRKKEWELMHFFYEGVRDIPGVTVYGDFSKEERAPIVTLNIRDYDSGEVSDVLAQDYGILTRAGAHCAPLMHEALGTREQGAVRFSFSFHNTKEEAAAAVRAVRELAEEGGR